MRVSEIDFVKFLPDLMQDDPDVIAIAKAQTNFYRKIVEKINVLSRWGKFDQMTEEELDLFAEDFFIPWYKTSDTKDIKVSNLEHFVEVWSRLGTPKAIETVLEDIYGTAELIEWFSNKEDYVNGQFAVQVKDFASFTQENKRRFNNVLEIVKRKSQELSIIFTVASANVGYNVGLRTSILKNGTSSVMATVFLKDSKVSLNRYVGFKVYTIKTNKSLVIAE